MEEREESLKSVYEDNIIIRWPPGHHAGYASPVADLGVVRWVRTNHPSSGRNINLQTYIYSSVILSFKRLQR